VGEEMFWEGVEEEGGIRGKYCRWRTEGLPGKEGAQKLWLTFGGEGFWRRRRNRIVRSQSKRRPYSHGLYRGVGDRGGGEL